MTAHVVAVFKQTGKHGLINMLLFGSLTLLVKIKKIVCVQASFQIMLITNVRNPFYRLVGEQLTIKATEKKNYNRKDASTPRSVWIPLLPRLLT